MKKKRRSKRQAIRRAARRARRRLTAAQKAAGFGGSKMAKRRSSRGKSRGSRRARRAARRGFALTGGGGGMFGTLKGAVPLVLSTAGGVLGARFISAKVAEKVDRDSWLGRNPEAVSAGVAIAGGLILSRFSPKLGAGFLVGGLTDVVVKLAADRLNIPGMNGLGYTPEIFAQPPMLTQAQVSDLGNVGMFPGSAGSQYVRAGGAMN